MASNSAVLSASGSVRGARFNRAAIAFVLVLLASFLPELALAERKYALFGGGFGQSQALDRPGEAIVFLAAALWCQALLLYALFRLVARLHGRQGLSRLALLNFAAVSIFSALAIAVAKYQALSYFSDAISFQIVRNLAGGSLVQALLYALSEASLIAAFVLGAGLAYALLLFLTRRWWRGALPLAETGRIDGRALAIALAATPLLLFAANRVEDAEAALGRMNGYAAVSTLLHQATDFDRDGYSFFSRQIDLHPFDGSRHPYALDIPGNGVDEDGIGGDLAFAGDAGLVPTPVLAGERPHVVLIVLESTRADLIGKRIDGRAVAPFLEAMAAQGSKAEAAYSHVGFTTYSLQTLFTGRFDPDDDRQSLVRDFLANGYDANVFSGQPEDFGDTARIAGLRRARHYVDAQTLQAERASPFTALASLSVDGKLLLREFDRRLGDPAAWARPQFLYFNFQSAHFPYHAEGMDRILPGEPIPRSRISAANRDWLERTYWNAIAYNDRLIAAVAARLERLGVLDNSLIVVTADHGESLFDDGFLGHGHALNREQTAIPFILNRPGVELAGPIGLSDMRGIILRAAGADLAEPAPRRTVFQYLGSLERPGMIGRVDGEGNWTKFDLSKRALRIAGGDWRSYSRLSEAERQVADGLIDEWMRARIVQRRQSGRM